MFRVLLKKYPFYTLLLLTQSVEVRNLDKEKSLLMFLQRSFCFQLCLQTTARKSPISAADLSMLAFDTVLLTIEVLLSSGAHGHLVPGVFWS